MKPTVFLTRKLPEEGLSVLRQRSHFSVHTEDRVISRPELMQAVQGKDGLLCLLTDRINAEVMDAAGARLRVISNYAVGFNNIDVAAATERGIPVTNTPGVLTEASADLAWALLLAVGRRIVEGDRLAREGRFEGWAPMMLLGGQVYGRTLGIVGMGRIGQAVARRARGFSMRVLYHNRNRLNVDLEVELGCRYASLSELLRESDYVSLHVPLADETRHLIGARELAMMKPTAYLVNTARGPVVDEKALVEALKMGTIAGAGLDVYEDEPRLAEGLAELENAVLLPHIASATVETRTKMAQIAAANLLDVLDGRQPQHLVNPDVWDRRRR